MIKKLEALFNDWNKSNLIFENNTNFIEITTPFTDMHHDYIQLFFTEEKDGSYRLTDDGHIINELYMLGIDVNNSKKRKDFFDTTLRVFGVNFDSETEELFTSFDALSEYPAKQHNLIQCLIKISDMLLTAKNTVISIFTEEINTFFEESNIIFTPDLGINGKSGNQQNFDFVIPHSKNKKEKLIKAVNTPSANNYTGPLFSFIDVKDVRPNSDFVLIANDLNVPIANKFSKSLSNYNVKLMPWSKKKEWVDELRII